MIHHHPYDDYEAASRSSHYHRSSMPNRDVPSPPSFYAVPPPPHPSSLASADVHTHHQQHQPVLHPHLQSQNAHMYYPTTQSQQHPYLAHYPPPPPPPPAQFESRERGSMKRKTDFDDQVHSFTPYGYPQQRHYTYGHGNQIASGPVPVGYGKQQHQQQQPPHNYADVNRVAKVNNPAGEVYGMSLGDQQPTYVGHIKSANDAILLLSACDLPATAPISSSVDSRDNVLPAPRRVTRRLLDAERADLVASGSVFVWDEKEAGMKRWTDGRVWSASRVSGCFLTYRELEARKKVGSSGSAMVEGPATNQYKPDGLIKQSFSITTSSGRKLHVISYFTKRDIREGRLRRVGEDPRFVGEGGGEWGLKVDEQEYSFPDMQQIGRHHGQGDTGNTSTSRDQGDEEGSEMSELSDRRSPSLSRRISADALDKKDDAKRKRSTKGTEEEDLSSNQKSIRPRLSRVRSSSMSGLQSSGMNSSERTGNESSLQSNSSLATTVPSDTMSRSKEPKYRHGGLSVTTTNRGRSSAIRALLSPTIPRESALRDSACEMKPTQSQDCANAVGALLSLAGNSSTSTPDSAPASSQVEAKASAIVSSPIQAAEITSSSTSSPTSASPSQSVGLGLNVTGLPKRRQLDLAALNKFSVRL